MTWGFVTIEWLGGKDSNPQRQDQNLLCYRLHHPRKGAPAYLTAPTGYSSSTTRSTFAWRRNPMMRPTATATVSRAM